MTELKSKRIVFSSEVVVDGPNKEVLGNDFDILLFDKYDSYGRLLQWVQIKLMYI